MPIFKSHWQILPLAVFEMTDRRKAFIHWYTSRSNRSQSNVTDGDEKQKGKECAE